MGWVSDGLVWAFANVEADGSAFLDLLSNFISLWLVPWAAGGDLNMVTHSHKKRGNCLPCSMKLFSDFINDNELIDLLLLGRRFAWSNNREQVAIIRGGMFLISKK